MKPSHVALAIRQCIAMNKPLMIWGPPGVGKSDKVRDVCAQIAAEQARADDAWREEGSDTGLGFQMIDFRAALRDAVDIMGLPGAIDGRTFYNLPAGLPQDPAWRGVVFLDEIVSAPPQTQAALYQLVLDRGVGDYRLPDGAFIVAAGNRQSDRGVVHRMPDPLADRFFHVDFEPDLNDWCTWGYAAGIAAEVISFLRFRPALLFTHETKRECHAITTPRGWADVSGVLALGSEIEGELIRGRVGDGPAGEFMAFLKLFRQMISPDDVIANPKRATVPDNAGVLYALAEALARRATVENFGAVLVYAKRMPREYSACLVSSATRITPALCNTREFIDWASKNG